MNPLDTAVARVDALTRPKPVRVPDVRPRLDRDEEELPADYYASLYGAPVAPANSDRVDPEQDGREVVADPLDELRAAGALVGYQALVDATAVPPVSIWYPGIERDSHIEVSGPSGQGKTTLALLFAVARANPTGKPVRLLGRDVTPGDVGTFAVVLEEENGRFSLRRKLEVGCEILGLPVAATLNRMVLLVRRRVTAGDPTWNTVAALGRAHRVSVVVVDSRARVLRRGESNSEEDQAAMSNAIHQVVEACAAPVVVLSHTRKGERGGAPGEIEDVSGSLQRGAGADVVLLVTAKKSAAGKVVASTLKFAKLRDADEDHPEPVTYSIARDVEGRWVLSTEAAGVKDDRPLVDRVRDALAASTNPLTKQDLRKALGASGGDLEKALTVLFDGKEILPRSVEINGRQRKAFALREAT